MSTIPDDKIKEVRERAGILELVSDYVGLKKSGSSYMGLCPFHMEKTPSFTVNPGRGIFHCFGCGAGGDAFAFVMRIEGLSFPEAVKFLAKRVGVPIEERPLTSVEKEREDEREALFRISELAAKFYRRLLLEDKSGAPGRLYLERRGVDQETAEAYRMGFAPERWDALARFLEQKRVPMEMAAKLGLVRSRENGGWYDLFRNRLLFTICDLHGRPIAFGGRVLDDSLPKYINSPESPIYRKSDVLFGINLAKQAMRESGSAIVVEGYFDHLALYQAGFRNVVATCGTALTGGHSRLLRRYAEKVCTLFDADAAGKKATFRAMDIFLEESFPASVVELPPGEDPDTFIRKEGGEAFAARVKGALPIFDYYFRDLMRSRETGGVEGTMWVLDELAPRLKKIADPMQQNLYIREVARVVGVDERELRNKVGLSPRQGEKSAPRVEKRRSVGPEEMLLALMAKYPEVAERVVAYGAAKLFAPDLLPVAGAIIAVVSAGGEPDWSSILDNVSSAEERSHLASLLVSEEHLEEIDAQKAFDECRVTHERASLAEMKGLKRELALLDPESGRYLEILKRLDVLRNKKSQLY